MVRNNIVLPGAALIVLTMSGCSRTVASEGALTPKAQSSVSASTKATRVAALDPAANADPDKKICRRTLDTGSLVKATKVCFTRREWAAKSDDNKKFWEELQGSKGSTNGQ